jgi:hypothetical protein
MKGMHLHTSNKQKNGGIDEYVLQYGEATLIRMATLNIFLK